MTFPGLARFSVPLLDAGQPVARTGPPPDSFGRVSETDTDGKRPGGRISVRVLIDAAGTAHLRDLRREAMSGAATAQAGSRPGSLSLRRHSQSIEGASRPYPRSQVVSPCSRASGLVGFDNGRILHRRSRSVHKGHHHAARRARHPERSQPQLRSRRSHVAGSVDGSRGRGTLIHDRRPRHRRSTASASSDREPTDDHPRALAGGRFGADYREFPGLRSGDRCADADSGHRSPDLGDGTSLSVRSLPHAPGLCR